MVVHRRGGLKGPHTAGNIRSTGFLAFLAVITAIALPLAGALPALAAAYQAPTPVLITSIGQSPDAFTLNVLAARAKIDFQYENMADPSKLAGHKSLLLAVGASQKGFGAAGITLDSEQKRAAALLDEADEMGIPVIVAHIGGSDRRDPVTMKLLEGILPRTNFLIVYRGGNEDGFFTSEAERLGIPIVELDQVLQAAQLLEEVFSM